MLTLYDKDFKTKYGTIDYICEAFVEEERNGLFELSFIMLNTDSLFNYVKEDNIVVANANDTLLNQKFRIYMTRKLMNNRVEVYARHISFDLLHDYVDNISFENQSCEYALNMLFRNSNFSKHYKGYSDIINAQDYSMSMCNILEAIGGKAGSILDTFGTGAEILRDNENIHVLNKRGHDNSVTIEYKKNLTGFELEEDTTELITRILPYAKYTNNETNEEVIVKADYVDSTLIANYSHPFISAIDYSEKFEEDEEVTTSKLIKFAQDEFKINKVDLPKQNFKIEFIPLSRCVGYEGLEDKISLCDTVTIKDSRYNVNTQAKVIKTVFNVLKNRYESMELGEPKTSLGDIIGGGSDATVGPQGPQGPQGPPGADGEVGDFPNSLPSTPIVTTKVYGFSNIEISWTFENKVYYQYEVYASKDANFTPNTFNLIHQGQTSTYMYQAKPNETWYFKVCAMNTHGERTDFGYTYATTSKISDLSNYVGEMAIGDALIGELNLGRGWFGELKGNYIDAKQLSVTDGNGERTLDIDSFGNVHIKATSFSLQGKDIATEEELNKAVKSVDVMYYLSNSQTSLSGGSWSTTAPAWVNGKYMWSKTVTTFVNGTKSETSPVCIAGAKGDTGEAGKDGVNGTNGVGVKEIAEQYYLSTSKTQQIGGSWLSSPPTWVKGKYLWTRSKITYTDNTVVYTTPVCDSSWEAIEQQTSVDIFNKLTDNGKKQGLYMENDQLYINGQYVNAKNLSVVNNEGKQTFKIDSSGNVDIDPSSIEIGFNGINNRISINSRSMDFVASNGNKDMLLYGGQVCVYNNMDDTFLGTVGNILNNQNTNPGTGFQLSKHCDRFMIGRDANWDDILTNRSPGPKASLLIDYVNDTTTIYSKLHLADYLAMNSNNIIGAGKVGASKLVCSNFYSNDTSENLFLSYSSNKVNLGCNLNANGYNVENIQEVKSNKVICNNFYGNGNNHLFLRYDTDSKAIYAGTNLNMNGFAISGSKIANASVSANIESGYDIDIENDINVKIANEEISIVKEDASVEYDLNDMIKLLYSKIYSLEKEIKALKEK